MPWNYRIILHDTDADPKQHWMGLHEVYYDTDGQPNSWSSLANFVTDIDLGKNDIIDALELAVKTLRNPKFSDVLRLSELAKIDSPNYPMV